MSDLKDYPTWQDTLNDVHYQGVLEVNGKVTIDAEHYRNLREMSREWYGERQLRQYAEAKIDDLYKLANRADTGLEALLAKAVVDLAEALDGMLKFTQDRTDPHPYDIWKAATEAREKHAAAITAALAKIGRE